MAFVDRITGRATSIAKPREIEILRVAGSLPGVSHDLTTSDARTAVLRWAQKRRGAPLPAAAWQGLPFEYLTGGRTCVGVRLEAGNVDLWALRADDPDKNIAGRSWTTEIVIGRFGDEAPRFGARLFMATAEENPAIEIAVPGFIRQIANASGLKAGPLSCVDQAWWMQDESHAEELIAHLVDINRQLPLVVVATGSAGYDESALSFNPDSLAVDLMGIAHVAVIAEPLTWNLTEALGKPLSVFDGGIRVYQPGFTSDDDPFGPHQLILSRQLNTPQNTQAALSDLKRRLANDSVRRVQMGSTAVSYQDVRDAAFANRQATLEKEGGSSEEKLAAALNRIKSMEEQKQKSDEWNALLEADNVLLNDKSNKNEALAGANKVRIQQLETIIKDKGTSLDSLTSIPTDWSEFSNWCETNFPGRLLLSSAARKEVKQAEFEDVGLAARGVIWLAGEYRTARLEGGDGSLRDFAIEPGVWNSPCGADSYEIQWQKRKSKVDWHLKSGGNTRDPKRCFRAYYFWDSVSEQVIVDHLPGHRTTGAS